MLERIDPTGPTGSTVAVPDLWLADRASTTRLRRGWHAARRLAERRRGLHLATVEEILIRDGRLAIRCVRPYAELSIPGELVESITLELSKTALLVLRVVYTERSGATQRPSFWFRVRHLDRHDEARDLALRLGRALGLKAFREVPDDEDHVVEVHRRAPTVVASPFRGDDAPRAAWRALDGGAPAVADYALRSPATSVERPAPLAIDDELLATLRASPSPVMPLEAASSPERLRFARPAVFGQLIGWPKRLSRALVAFVLYGGIGFGGGHVVFGLVVWPAVFLIGRIGGVELDGGPVVSVASALLGLFLGWSNAHMSWEDRGTPPVLARAARIDLGRLEIVLRLGDEERRLGPRDLEAVRLDVRAARRADVYLVTRTGEELIFSHETDDPDCRRAARRLAEALAARFGRDLELCEDRP